ncbi:prepilin-type N-terminal cleavage/methylation domain-containing protein [Candidatus Williamhamiltonella defendens]|uniref:Prepilin peptidase dependent protein C-like C-terminal domain-containing protein n=1 Tax=Candidatus Hamiltonella defensa (Bemisia tabaci) TaxID=672795 RepID=A0A249DZK5_9ENTR|nr:prepilin-type N-terminal cleavage/methylation domain-containing protein [Candidatus Hamiltonella defensa]ASX26212.1 hypothetical protein BA171_03740 [Candidatus Hamiltonella defensa (Bemisia tabaci)]CED79266.1 Prepilin peptidase-dependent protein C precursor [Candidatus Hamiltonella defensa (Bemisia tabaci)]
MKNNKKLQFNLLTSQKGFSVFEALIAALLFSISALGLLEYQQKLLQGFQRQWQMRQASALIQQNIEIFSETHHPVFSKFTNPTSGWKIEKIPGRVNANCINFHVEATSPQNQKFSLNRWFCE